MAVRGLTVFFTGLSGAGKTTTAQALAARLREYDARSITVLDGDAVRQRLSPELGFDRNDREQNIRRIGSMAAEVAAAGGIAVCAAIAPYEALRRSLRAIAEAAGAYVLVYMATPLHVCELRDPKGLYARARAGTLPLFTGISDPYEPPLDADLALDTTTRTPEDCARCILTLLTQRGLLAPMTQQL